jgi:hypothetical protein
VSSLAIVHSHRAARVQGHNPFSTRYVRPGAIAFRFPPDCGIGLLVDRLRSNDWWGQIVGPHGSGKSSLLAALTPALSDSGRRVVRLTLHDGQRRLGAAWHRCETLDTESQVVVDGYEQLSAWSKRGLKRHCRRRGAGLLVTSHDDVGLPLLFTANPDLEMAQRVVAGLLLPGDRTIDCNDVVRAWQARGGNLREALFDLYRLYEERRD